MVMPPGYLTPRSFKSVMAGKANMRGAQRTVQSLMDQGIFICGSPETVRRKLTECHAQTGFQNFIAFAHFGTMPHDLTVKNIELLARHVIPHLKTLGDDNFHGLAAAAQ
jgi:alkanesulfonate monooxygenase SsuD/methylene tetrahydromethanopterin reductase-like flavin-dependent oxidoreductase (luciferase family)